MEHMIADFPSVKILELFEPTSRWILDRQAEGLNVLIHCAAGVSRSASFVIAHLMYTQKIGFQ